jgi:hypothetical protein
MRAKNLRYRVLSGGGAFAQLVAAAAQTIAEVFDRVVFSFTYELTHGSSYREEVGAYFSILVLCTNRK